MNNTTVRLTFGVCVEGAMPQPESEHEFHDAEDAIAKAVEIKEADPDALVTICLWTADE